MFKILLAVMLVAVCAVQVRANDFAKALKEMRGPAISFVSTSSTANRAPIRFVADGDTPCANGQCNLSRGSGAGSGLVIQPIALGDTTASVLQNTQGTCDSVGGCSGGGCSSGGCGGGGGGGGGGGRFFRRR